MAPIKSNSPWQKVPVPEHLADERRQAPDAILAALGDPTGEKRNAALTEATRIAKEYDAAAEKSDKSIGLGEARESVDQLARAAKAFLAAARDTLETDAWSYGGTATNDPALSAAQKIALRDDDPLRQDIAEARRTVNDLASKLEARLAGHWPRRGQLTLDAMTVGTRDHALVQSCYDLWRTYRNDMPGGDQGPFLRLVRGVYCLTDSHLSEPDKSFSGLVRALAQRLKDSGS
jgi:hypothetical protein